MAKAAAVESEARGIEIPEIHIETFRVKLIGDSPLIMHKWSEKAKKQMLDKTMKKATAGKEAKDPFREFCDAMYWLTEKPENPTMDDVMSAKYGFPTTAFKAAAIDAGFQQGILEKKTTARGAFHIIGEYAVIEGTPEMREDTVRIGISGAELRYRGEFKNWGTILTIRYNPMAMSMEQIVNLFNMGGFANGVGEWRPAKDGVYGTFHVATQGE